jgi:hypothetical protein
MLLKNERGMAKNDTRPHASGGYSAPIGEFGQRPPMRGKDPCRSPLSAGGCKEPDPMPNAWWGQGLGRPSGQPERKFQAWGVYTREAKATRRVMRATIREIRALVQAADPRKQ